ncbi:MAG: hypothetical protein KGJ86_18475, partial [Chloroflexota bacterium]|nr:hypothetical protein [Chloroflexota bacterium]
DRVFLERYVGRGRHVEVQVFGDGQGRVMHLGERDCSIQRRYQKIVEEAPAPNLSDALCRRLHQSAVALAKAAGYVGPGTVEFVVEGDDCFFLEMNTRLQVEHPVTEMVAGLDLAKLQLQVAFGGSLPPQPALRGHSIEARVYAEDPDGGFLPASGVIRRLRLPEGAGIRNEVGVQVGDEIGVRYDPLLAKLIVWGSDRKEALVRLQEALRHYCLLGVTTNLPFLLRLARDADFAEANFTTQFLSEHALPSEPSEDLEIAASAWQAVRRSPDPFRHGWRGSEDAHILPDGSLALDGRVYDVVEDEQNIEVWHDGRRGVFAKAQPPSLEAAALGHSSADGTRSLTAPMPGVVSKVLVKEGDDVIEHQTLVVLEAMKMEHNVQSASAGVVRRVRFRKGDLVPAGAVLVEIE